MQSSDTIDMVFSAENNAELDSVKTILDTILEAKRKLLVTNKKTAEEFDALMSSLFPLFKDKYPTWH
jgi:hypothetical protein